MEFKKSNIKDISLDIKAPRGKIVSTEYTTADASSIGRTNDSINEDVDNFVELMELIMNKKSSKGINYGNILLDGYSPQGHAESDDELIISAYDNKFLPQFTSDEGRAAKANLSNRDYEVTKNKNSRLYIYDKGTHQYIGKIVLPTSAHVGGASLDSEHNILYVTDKSGKVKAYNYDAIISTLKERGKNEEKPTIDFSEDGLDSSLIEIDSDISIRKTLGNKEAKASTCTYHDGALYVATFDYSGALVKYEIEYNEDGSITTKGTVLSNELPAAVQGVSFYTDPKTGEEYLITCQSYGGKAFGFGTSTCLKKYKITDDGKLEFAGQKELKHGFGEGIYCDENGNITVVNELGNTVVHDTNINELTDEWSPELESKYKSGVEVHKKDFSEWFGHLEM